MCLALEYKIEFLDKHIENVLSQRIKMLLLKIDSLTNFLSGKFVSDDNCRTPKFALPFSFLPDQQLHQEALI